MQNPHRETLGLIAAGLLVAAGTPVLLSLRRPGLTFYLLQAPLVAIESVPYVVAAVLWLPPRSPDGVKIGRRLATVLCGAALLIHVPMLIGLWPVGGDMVGFGFMLISIGTTIGVVIATAAFHAVTWVGRRRKVSASALNHRVE